ncbi:MAG: hypothetical protein U1E89_04565 [Burkholderiaceae bacterium]
MQRWRAIGVVSAASLLASLTACGQPVPAEKAAYVGDWHGTGMDLYIDQDGTVAYKRYGGGSSRSLELPLREFQGDDFVVGVGPLSTTFQVSVPPHQDGTGWKMTVDGVELHR